MVDFNSEVTVGTPAANVQRILILEARQYIIDAIEAYYKVQTQTRSVTDVSVAKARLIALFLQVRAAIERSNGTAEHEEIYKLIMGCRDIDDILTGFRRLDDFLDKKRIIRVDLKREYDPKNVEAEAEEYGL